MWALSICRVCMGTIALHMHVLGQIPNLRGPRTAWSLLLTSFREEVHLHRGSGESSCT